MADLDRSGAVGLDDFFMLADEFSETCDTDPTSDCFLADIDRDGTVEIDDFLLLADEFGRPCTGGDTSGPCIGSGDHTSIQEALDGEEAEAVLCPEAVFTIDETILFTADRQEIYTRGFPRDDIRAVLKSTGADAAAVVMAGNNSGVHLQNVIIDGNRPELGTAAPALIEFGSTGTGNVVGWVKVFEPRGWSALYIGEGDDRRCRRGIARYNELGPAGQPHHIIADGISVACPNSIIEHNTIVDATDGGIVVFQAPGSTIANNTITARERIMFYGISMEDYGPWDGDFTGTRIIGNTIDAAGKLIRRGISMGPYLGCVPSEETVLRSRGATVADNILRGDHMGWGFIVGGVEDWTASGNIDLSTHRTPPWPQDCFGSAVDAPGGFQIKGAISLGNFQQEFEEAIMGFTVNWWPAQAVFEEVCMADLIGEDNLTAIKNGERGDLWTALEAACRCFRPGLAGTGEWPPHRDAGRPPVSPLSAAGEFFAVSLQSGL